MNIAGFWSYITRVLRLLRTPYTRSLEDELTRVRAENRALMNSILGIAGMPPLPLETKLARDRRRAMALRTSAGTAPETPTAAGKSASRTARETSAPQTPAGQ